MKIISIKTLACLCIGLLLVLNLFSAPIDIPLGGNAYLTKDIDGAKITDEGICEWTNPETVISSWFRINQTGQLNLSIRAKALSEDVKIEVLVNERTYTIDLLSKDWTVYPIADNIDIASPGYFKVEIKGINKKGEYFADLSDLVIDGSCLETPPNYVKDFSYYFGRRGPSVHMKYELPENEIFEYFYNEVTVPLGNDVVGSYYMANGFGEGYFGMQVNSDSERRILFSVWSPHVTDNPQEIPENLRIRKVRQGEGVHIGEFGSEGSGGQSYLRYPWKAGVTYKFLSQVRPDGNGNTTYTGYFYATDEGVWKLIASFVRPETDTWYKHPHSFLENFIPNQGYITREVLFGNQWAITNKGKWVELNKGIFTYDLTAREGMRIDYMGGVISDQFFLKNCGFFDQSTAFKEIFTRKPGTKRPKIDLKQLESLKK